MLMILNKFAYLMKGRNKMKQVLKNMMIGFIVMSMVAVFAPVKVSADERYQAYQVSIEQPVTGEYAYIEGANYFGTLPATIGDRPTVIVKNNNGYSKVVGLNIVDPVDGTKTRIASKYLARTYRNEQNMNFDLSVDFVQSYGSYIRYDDSGNVGKEGYFKVQPIVETADNNNQEFEVRVKNPNKAYIEDAQYGVYQAQYGSKPTVILTKTFYDLDDIVGLYIVNPYTNQKVEISKSYLARTYRNMKNMNFTLSKDFARRYKNYIVNNGYGASKIVVEPKLKSASEIDYR